MEIKTSKLLIITLLAFIMFSIVPSNTYATSIGDIFSAADSFIDKAEENEKETITEDTIKGMSNILYNILLIIGIVVAVIVGMLIGIKFMTGSIEEKAKVKEAFIAYIAGCIVVFGAFTIWNIVVTVLQSTSAT